MSYGYVYVAHLTDAPKMVYRSTLMSRIQVEQMCNTECLVFIRALRPFKVKKYRLEEHPNYKYTAEADKRYLRANPYLLEHNDEEIEAMRVKPVGEEGYIAPVVVNSARKRVLEVEKRKRVQVAAEKVLTVESSEVLREFDVEEMRIVDAF